MKDLIIIGAGGFGREVAWLVERINAKKQMWNLLGFADDAKERQGMILNSYPVLGGCECLSNYPNVNVVCAVGAAQIRRSIISRIEAEFPDVKYATLIDPSVECSDAVSIGNGTIVCAQTVMTVNITIGKHVILNLDCTIGHDVVLNDFVTVYPSVNVSGNVVVDSCVELGTGTQIIQGKRIGQNSIVGAGSVVVKDIPENCTAVGCPARPVK